MARDGTASIGVVTSTPAPEAREHTAEGHVEQAVAALYQRHARYVFRVLCRMGVAERDVEDLCQDVFVTAHRRYHDFRGDGAVTSWLYGICLRQAANYRRRAHRRREAVVDVLPEPREPADPVRREPGDPERTAEERELRRALDRALAKLSRRKREVFVLYEFAELDMPEVAAAVGAPLKTCYSRLHAARRELRAQLAKQRTRGEAP